MLPSMTMLEKKERGERRRRRRAERIFRGFPSKQLELLRHGEGNYLQVVSGMEIKVSKLHWLPWIFVFTMTITVMVVYAWSVLIGDVPVFLPYVSDAGGNPPQSALFGLALIACILSGLVPMVVRFFAVRAVECKHRKFVTLLNYLSLVSAVLAGVVAAFAPFNSLDDFKPNPNRGTLYRGLSPWSSVGEWVLILGLMCNFLTLSADMKAVNITVNLENVAVNSEAQQEKESNNEMMKF
ncbi:hypothetical protein HPB50_021355 [Hyalomma asiaticum]|uniref:Uncharacterized protein n=1 Tax=Hyalomma asiaticum TaxID=266040 RepID=A0ACB7SS43_HYAAI|nr:hypothetical protein HPB50_021355 [Hyalomma asiaticum]